MHNLIGSHLGQYEIKDHIAKGGMAQVYLARQASMNRDVAVKILPSEFTEDESFMERFYLEVEVIANLQHPHILPVHDFGKHEDAPYIVMAYLNGGTLADKMAGGMLTVDETVRIMQQVADALDFAHGKGIVHRDFKPGNVLLDEQGNAYLADFGLAKIIKADSKVTQMGVIGTPYYMAPEQSMGVDITHTVDVYAMGVTLYELLTGSVPYDGASMTAVLVAHIQEPIPDILLSRPDLPDAIQQVIEKSMAKQAENRFESAGEMARELRAVLQGSSSAGTTLAEITAQPALLMTNMLGHVIFVDNQCLNLLKRHHNEARIIVGKPIWDVLGLDDSVAKQILSNISTQGEINDLELDIVDSRDRSKRVLLSATATRDDNGDYVGADIRLEYQPQQQDRPPSSDFETMQPSVNTQEQLYLQTYFITQLESLYKLSANWGGKKVANRFESIINETGRRNVWPISMEKGQVKVELKQADIDMYKALVARGLAYAAHILGTKQVTKEMEHINKTISPNILMFVQTLGLDQLYNDILQ